MGSSTAHQCAHIVRNIGNVNPNSILCHYSKATVIGFKYLGKTFSLLLEKRNTASHPCCLGRSVSEQANYRRVFKLQTSGSETGQHRHRHVPSLLKHESRDVFTRARTDIRSRLSRIQRIWWKRRGLRRFEVRGHRARKAKVATGGSPYGVGPYGRASATVHVFFKKTNNMFLGCFDPLYDTCLNSECKSELYWLGCRQFIPVATLLFSMKCSNMKWSNNSLLALQHIQRTLQRWGRVQSLRDGRMCSCHWGSKTCIHVRGPSRKRVDLCAPLLRTTATCAHAAATCFHPPSQASQLQDSAELHQWIGFSPGY